MRRRLVHLLAACVLVASLGALATDRAQACITIPGDLRVINRAIDSRNTPKVDKRQLKRLRAVMLANRGAAPQQVAKYQTASLKALKLIGEDTIVPHDAAKAAATPNAIKGTFVGC